MNNFFTHAVVTLYRQTSILITSVVSSQLSLSLYICVYVFTIILLMQFIFFPNQPSKGLDAFQVCVSSE